MLASQAHAFPTVHHGDEQVTSERRASDTIGYTPPEPKIRFSVHASSSKQEASHKSHRNSWQSAMQTRTSTECANETNRSTNTPLLIIPPSHQRPSHAQHIALSRRQYLISNSLHEQEAYAANDADDVEHVPRDRCLGLARRVPHVRDGRREEEDQEVLRGAGSGCVTRKGTSTLAHHVLAPWRCTSS